ncbi:hypothetical protein BOTCAL_0391g00030 [Botryotinia calthae]|uniref:Uncharacterized protein n=1 Tax=Botryotinia calthae TaxID=38488 RepID=A0A4Y8CRJ4_9HELO|nr:hypothetical protein BOTCAL_0391g00030 [Botryotinia calthae]
MQTSISYLAQDPIFDIEKPFDSDVPVDHIPGARASNHQNDERVVRKRDPDFPANIRIYTMVEQPARRPHSDCSPKGAHMNLERAFPGQKAFWEGKNFDILNVWRPLRGPNNDWPLAMCDWTTIASTDIRVNDAIRRDRVDENAILHYNENHKWYFMRDQSVEDFIVFRNADSFSKRAQGFHCSVFNPEASGQLRESVEVRMENTGGSQFTLGISFTTTSERDQRRNAAIQHLDDCSTDNYSILTVPRPLAALLLIVFNVIIDGCINHYREHELDIWFFTQRSHDPDMQMDKQDKSSAMKGDFSRPRSSSTAVRSPTSTTPQSFNLVPLMRTANQPLKREEFNVIWRIMEREKPTVAFEVWQWCLVVLNSFQTLQAVETISIENVYQDLLRGKSVAISISEKDRTLLAIFAVLCWTSMMLDPDLEFEQSHDSTTTGRHLAFRA